jgi:rSAM/selenodomain-associated transferase 1
VQTPLIIFAKKPTPGRVKSRLIPLLGADRAAKLYLCMLKDILERTANLAGMDQFLFYQEDEGAAAFFAELAPTIAAAPQRGSDLGERLAHAFADIFSKGYTRALVIGTDSPDLPLPFLQDAVDRLQRGADAVIGPTDDGGYYLLGVNGKQPELFRQIPWSTSAVFAATMARGASLGLRMEILPSWYDVDRAEDLQRASLVAEGNEAPRTREMVLKMREKPVH